MAEVERIESGTRELIALLASLPLAPKWTAAVNVPISIRYDYGDPFEAAAEAARSPW